MLKICKIHLFLFNKSLQSLCFNMWKIQQNILYQSTIDVLLAQNYTYLKEEGFDKNMLQNRQRRTAINTLLWQLGYIHRN